LHGVTGSTFRDHCAFCGSRDLESIIDFGDVALAGAFVKPHQFAREPRYRLRVFFCPRCYALQLPDVVDPAELFANYFYFSSAIGSLREHFLDYASEVTARFLRPERSTVVEIGCNDGILLKPLADQGVRKPIGVDPASNIVQAIADPRITVVNDFFGSKLRRLSAASTVGRPRGSNNVSLTSGINDVTRGCELLPKSVFAFEVHHLGSVLRGLQYDMIYHEHLYYYSLVALEKHLRRHGMVVFDLKRIPIHGGSIRYYACKAGSRWAKAITNRVLLLRQDETAQGLERVETFQHFAGEIARRKDLLMGFLKRLHKAGKRMARYGASNHANTIIQYCDIKHEHMEYMIDDAPKGYYARLALRDPFGECAAQAGTT
jgi:hypothetical protein